MRHRSTGCATTTTAAGSALAVDRCRCDSLAISTAAGATDRGLIATTTAATGPQRADAPPPAALPPPVPGSSPG